MEPQKGSRTLTELVGQSHTIGSNPPTVTPKPTLDELLPPDDSAQIKVNFEFFSLSINMKIKYVSFLLFRKNRKKNMIYLLN
jgi:hypothetical protein